MNESEVIQHIKDLCIERNWSYYQLAKSSQLPYSTISTLLNNRCKPSFITLSKICDGLGISLADFFDSGRDMRNMSEAQQECLSSFNCMSEQQQQITLAFMKGVLSQKNE